VRDRKGSKETINCNTLLQYYIDQYKNHYTSTYTPAFWVRDANKVRLILEKFVREGRRKEEVILFIDWCFENKVPRLRNDTILGIGLLKIFADEYLALGIRGRTTKSAKFYEDEDGNKRVKI